MKRLLIAAALALGLSATGAAALPHFVCQTAGEVAHTAMAYRQAGYSQEQLLEALEPEIASIRLQAGFFGISDATLDRYEALARQHLVPILYNIRIQRTERARERVTIRAGEIAYERCRAQ